MVESLDHLRPWMPWTADEPIDLAARVELLRTFRGRFDLGEEFVYAVLDRGESRVLGGTGLHLRSGPALAGDRLLDPRRPCRAGSCDRGSRSADPRRDRDRRHVSGRDSLRPGQRGERAGAREARVQARGDAAPDPDRRGRLGARRDDLGAARRRVSGEPGRGQSSWRRSTRPGSGCCEVRPARMVARRAGRSCVAGSAALAGRGVLVGVAARDRAAVRAGSRIVRRSCDVAKTESAAMLKVNFPEPESEHEADALAHWDGDGAVALLAHDPTSRACALVERCEPGDAALGAGRRAGGEPHSSQTCSAASGVRLRRPHQFSAARR